MEHREPNIEPEVVSWEMAAVLRAMTPAERIQCLQKLWWFGRKVVKAEIRSAHPNWDEDQVHRETAGRIAADSDWAPNICLDLDLNPYVSK